MADQNDAREDQVERLGEAFRWIAIERDAEPGLPLDFLIRAACYIHRLTPAQATWMRWSLDPTAVAVQSKEPAAAL